MAQLDEEYEYAFEPFEESEFYDGVRLTFNEFPSTYVGAKKLVIPLSCLYTPLKRADEMNRVTHDPILCQGCSGVLNCFVDEIDFIQKRWVCKFCKQRNPFPPSYANSVHQDNLPDELRDQYTTIEYQPDQDPMYPPAILFVIDTCMNDDDELAGLCTVISQLFSQFPPEIAEQVYIGIITFGKHVSVHELGFEHCSKVHVFRGDSEEPPTKEDIDKIKSQLNITPDEISRFLLPLSDCEEQLGEILGNLQRDAWPQRPQQRPDRSTGVAVQVAVALMESVCPSQSARIMLFSGGVCSVGHGKIVDSSRTEDIRSMGDIVKGKAKYYDSARQFYSGLANRAVANGHVIDMFACCLDQSGVAEQRVLVDNTGGILILSDTFTTNLFSESFLKLFTTNRHTELEMCFNCELKIVTSPEIRVSGCVGPVTSMGEQSPAVSSSTVGVGGTCKWSLGGVDPRTTVCFFFEINNKVPRKLERETGYMQFITTYRDSNGYNITRTTTIAVRFKNPETKQGLNDIKENFDQECAAVCLAREGTFRAENEYDLNIINWLDRVLIKSMSKVASYKEDQPSTFDLVPEFANFPTFIFHLRRSHFVRVFGKSADESAFHRFWLLRSPCQDCMLMIQPEFTQFAFEEEPSPVPLDIASMQDEVILLLDTFFNVIKWTGEEVAGWRQDNLREMEEWSAVGAMLDESEASMVEKCQSRIPYPVEIRCDRGTSQERFVLAKVNASEKSGGQVNNGLWTDDVNLDKFMHHLKKLATLSAQ